ncbi:MAG: biotin/lipoyl-containing protein, partial [Thioalkalivibrio sp.]
MDIKVPDIGDFSDVPVVSILVSVGDTIAEEDPLLELESDKATMEVPSPAAGKITEIKVKEGDTVSEGTPIMVIEAAEAAQEAPKSEAPKAEAPKAAAPAPQPATGTASGKGDKHADLVVLGSGPGGYSAAFRAADLGQKVILVERY